MRRLFTPQTLTKIQKNSFIQKRLASKITLSDSDKWTKDGKKYPFVAPGRIALVSNNVYRHAYNEGQQGYYYLACKELLKFMEKNVLPSYANEEYYKNMKELGLPEELSHDVVATLLVQGASDIKEMLQIVINYYEAERRIDSAELEFGEEFHPKYQDYVEKMKRFTAAKFQSERRLKILVKANYALLGGWSAYYKGLSMDFTTKSELEQKPDELEELAP